MRSFHAGQRGVMRQRVMKRYNKIIVASMMFEESVRIFNAAQSDIDYISSIMLSGAVVGTIAPLLEEQGGHPMHEILSRIGNVMSSVGEEKQHPGIYRQTYNSLKHSGNKARKIKASEDLEFESDLRLEAVRMLDVAKSDFREVVVPEHVRAKIAPSFLLLLESNREFA